MRQYRHAKYQSAASSDDDTTTFSSVLPAIVIVFGDDITGLLGDHIDVCSYNIFPGCAGKRWHRQREIFRTPRTRKRLSKQPLDHLLRR